MVEKMAERWAGLWVETTAVVKAKATVAWTAKLWADLRESVKVILLAATTVHRKAQWMVVWKVVLTVAWLA